MQNSSAQHSNKNNSSNLDLPELKDNNSVDDSANTITLPSLGKTSTNTNFQDNSYTQQQMIQNNTFSNQVDIQNLINAPHTPKKYGGKKIIAAILGIMIMVGAITASVFSIQNQQLKIGSAWDCSRYKFNVSRTGVVTVQNGSRYNEPPQSAEVYINNTLVSTLSVPALSSGQGATLGTVSVPSQQGFTWKVHGTIDCENEGSYQAEATATPTISISASCNTVIAYDKDWKQLNSQQLSQLKPGDVVRFSVGGTTSSGSFDKARFTINGVQRPETTKLRPNTSEFYDEYTIPSDVTIFEVKAQIHHSQLGWI